MFDINQNVKLQLYCSYCYPNGIYRGSLSNYEIEQRIITIFNNLFESYGISITDSTNRYFSFVLEVKQYITPRGGDLGISKKYLDLLCKIEGLEREIASN